MFNNRYTQVENTVVSQTSLEQARSADPQSAGSYRVLQGSFTPTAAGDYAVAGADGVTLQLPATSYVVSCILTAPVTLVGGTDVNVGGAASNGGTVATTLSGGVQTRAVVNAGHTQASDTILGATNFWLSATTTGTYTAGKVQVVLVVVDN